MRNFMSLFKDSAKELKNLRCITVSAMLGALAIVLSFLTITSDSLKVGISSLPGRVVFFLFGPFVGAVYGVAKDILNYIIRPTGPFHPGFTLNAALSGVIFGLILYKRPLKFIRVFIAITLNAIVVNIILNTYWLTTIVGKGFWVLLPARLTKNIIFLPIEALLLFMVIKAIKAAGVMKLVKQGENEVY